MLKPYKCVKQRGGHKRETHSTVKLLRAKDEMQRGILAPLWWGLFDYVIFMQKNTNVSRDWSELERLKSIMR